MDVVVDECSLCCAIVLPNFFNFRMISGDIVEEGRGHSFLEFQDFFEIVHCVTGLAFFWLVERGYLIGVVEIIRA